MHEALGRPDALPGFLEAVHRLFEDGVFVGHDRSIRVDWQPPRGRGIGVSFGVSRPFTLLQRRVGGRLASHPSLPPSWHQSTHLLATKRALKALQQILTTLNASDVRLG